MSDKYHPKGRVFRRKDGPWEFQVDPHDLLWILIHNEKPRYRVVWQGNPQGELEIKDVSFFKEDGKPQPELFQAGHAKSRDGFLGLWQGACREALAVYRGESPISPESYKDAVLLLSKVGLPPDLTQVAIQAAEEFEFLQWLKDSVSLN